MHFADPKHFVTTVRLFPRLAMAHASRRPATRRIDLAHIPKNSASEIGHEERRSQVRARLFRMIVDNEQVRRNEQRPSAS